jgi:peptidoglycan hydrolase-like protein with peptidoglycan-binding domain
MRKILLMTAAAALVSLPSFMQANAQTGGMSQSNSHMQQNSQQNAGASNQENANNQISPDQLNNSEVREIQQALNKKGFNTGKVDGIWGPETRQAVEQFQRKQNIQANGELDQHTLSALGVQLASQNKSGQPSTTGSGSSGSNNTSQPQSK